MTSVKQIKRDIITLCCLIYYRAIGRSIDTNDNRTYCLNHMGGVFDHSYLKSYKNLYLRIEYD